MDRTIIRLGPQHRDAAVATLAAAFQADPAIAFMMPNPASRPAQLARLYRWMFAEHLKNGVVLGTPGAEVVTLWRLPGSVHLHEPIWHPGALRFVPIFGRHIPRAIRLDDAIRAHLPADEQWHYLRVAGVRPDCQGKGLGGLAIRAGLAEAAARGVPAVLETATPSNVGLYQRLGYQVISQWTVPGGGPQFWTMTNTASAA
jgi:GNAT superfamily N-acetyltransferase